jgi:NADPH:quinone reductase-like Zn-dependent oxidoreductase
VREVGAGVTGFAPGDKVMGVAGSSYAELVAANANAITKVPEGLDPVEAAALPVVTLTGEQLITLGTGVKAGQTVLITGTLGSVGRSAVWTAKKAGAMVIAGVKGSQVEAVGTLGVDQVLALDDATALEKLGFVDAVADTVGGPTGEKLLGKVKPGGVFASVLGGPANAKLHPTIRVQSVVMHPDAAMLRILAETVAAGKLVIPIDRMVPLDEAAQAQVAAEKGGIGKILLLA